MDRRKGERQKTHAGKLAVERRNDTPTSNAKRSLNAVTLGKKYGLLGSIPSDYVSHGISDVLCSFQARQNL
jgi:hypothetical protein